MKYGPQLTVHVELGSRTEFIYVCSITDDISVTGKHLERIGKNDNLYVRSAGWCEVRVTVLAVVGAECRL